MNLENKSEKRAPSLYNSRYYADIGLEWLMKTSINFGHDSLVEI